MLAVWNRDCLFLSLNFLALQNKKQTMKGDLFGGKEDLNVVYA